MAWSKITTDFRKPIGWWYHKVLCELGYALRKYIGLKMYNTHLDAMLFDYSLNLYGERIKMHKNNKRGQGIKYLDARAKSKGHTFWRLNIKTEEISRAPIEYVNFNGIVKPIIIQEDGFWYCAALNKNNAFERFNKMAELVLKRYKK